MPEPGRSPGLDRRTLVRVLWCEVASIAVILTGDVTWIVSIAVLCLIPLFGLSEERSGWRKPLRQASSILAVFYLIFFPLDWFYLSGRLIFATVHLMFYLKLHTLLHQDSPRERSRLHLICLFEMLAAASMTVEARFVFPLALFVFLGTLVLVLEQTRPRHVDASLLKPSIVSSVRIAVPLLFLSAVVFVVLPRSTYGGFRLGGVRGLTVTGFSEQVRLGAFEEIKRSRDIVMRIVTDAPDAPSPPRWRGPAYDEYENGEWRQSLTGVSSLPRSRAGEFLLDATSSDVQVASQVLLEPLDTDVLFLPPASASVWTTERFVFVDPYRTLRTGRAARAGRRYNVSWRPQRPENSSALGGVERLSEGRRRLYTRIPELSERFHQLVQEVVGQRTDLDAARVVEAHLRETYGYTLRQPERGRGDPLEDFLFDARAGHCEYFATAMAMMLRARGIPSRLVTGFNRGRKNALGEFEVVRRTNAHAWVEVFDEAGGWVAFDPTPPVLDADVQALGSFIEGIDSLRMLWDFYVVAFDAERQRGVWGGAGAMADAALAAAAGAYRLARDKAAYLLGLGLVVIAMALLRRTKWGWRLWLRAPRMRRPREKRPEATIRFYAKLLTRLERLGVAKPASHTPAEFARAMEANLPGITEVTALYYRARYGGEILARGEAVRAERLSTAICLAAVSDRRRVV